MAKAESRPSVVQAREAFLCEVDGETFDIREGDLFEPAHPVVRKYPGHFREPVFRFPLRGVEQATAAPGEKRGS